MSWTLAPRNNAMNCVTSDCFLSFFLCLHALCLWILFHVLDPCLWCSCLWLICAHLCRRYRRKSKLGGISLKNTFSQAMPFDPCLFLCLRPRLCPYKWPDTVGRRWRGSQGGRAAQVMQSQPRIGLPPHNSHREASKAT